MYSQPLAESRYSVRPDVGAIMDGCLAQGPRMKEPFSCSAPLRNAFKSPSVKLLKPGLATAWTWTLFRLWELFLGDRLTADSSSGVFGSC